jgi:hypothetical protein
MIETNFKKGQRPASEKKTIGSGRGGAKGRKMAVYLSQGADNAGYSIRIRPVVAGGMH